MVGAGIRSLKTRSRHKAEAFDGHRDELTHKVKYLHLTARRTLTSREALILAFVAGLTVETLSPAQRRVQQRVSEDDEREGQLRATFRRVLHLAAMVLARKFVDRLVSG